MINKNILKIEEAKTFSDLTRRINEYKKAHPRNEVISLGIGDVSFPVVKPIINAMHKAVDEVSRMETFQGYGLYYGLEVLRKKISEKEYSKLDISDEEIFIGDGTKSDCGNILELFSKDVKVLLANPLYPIYLNSSLCMNRKVFFTNLDEDYKMIVPKEKYDVIYICSPCNPIGNAYNYDDLKKWVNYANDNDAVIIYDNVYNAFIESEDVPRSIYEIAGSKKCCIELRSFSKNASFTGVRCSYLVMPKEFKGNLIPLWRQRCINRFNGASYIAQKGALASYSNAAQKEIKKHIEKYKENAAYLKESLISLGFEVVGGIDSPYLWVNTKDNMDSYEAFDFFLNKLNIIVIPGEIFGSNGKNHIRISALGRKENSVKAIERIKKYYEKEI